MTAYEQKLDQVVRKALSIRGTGGHRALRTILNDLNSDSGPISELLFTLDQENFDMVIDLLVEFRRSGQYAAFNALHKRASDRITGTTA